MPSWLTAMQQTYEYYVVDPGTWKDVRQITDVKSCTITRDLDTDTLGSATIDVSESLGECYIRVYLVTIQNGLKEKHPLGTYLIQTPAANYDGRRRGFSMDAYTPLLELKETPPPLGYTILKDLNIMDSAYTLIREKVRAPVVWSMGACETILYSHFVSNVNDTWLTFVRDLLAMAKYQLSLDELGRILFAPVQETAAMQPVWTYDDGNSSILYPDITMDRDLYGIPNVVEVLYSKPARASTSDAYYSARVVNDDPNSPTSTVARGREIVKRIVDPNIGGVPTQAQVQEYAQRMLRELSVIEYAVTYKHGYCPVRVGDCVRLNYSRAGFTNIKAKVISQTIKCEPGCPVTEKAIFTAKLWR